MHAGRDIFLYFCREIRSKRILSFCSARCCFVRCVVRQKGIYVFHGCCWEQIKTFSTGLAAGLGVARRVGTRVKVWAGRQRWLWSTTQLAVVQLCTPVPTAVWQLGSRYNFMEKQQCFSPTFDFKKSHYVSLCTFQTMERWASSINNEILPFFPMELFLFCPLRASCCWMETSMDMWNDAMAGGGEGARSFAELLSLWRVQGGVAGGKLLLRQSWGKAGRRQHSGKSHLPGQHCLPPLGPRCFRGATGYAGFAVCLGRRRKLGVEGGEYGASADKIQGMQQKKWKKKHPKIYGRRRTLLIALVKCNCGGRKHDLCWQGRKSSRNRCILAVRERTAFRVITFPRYTPVWQRLRDAMAGSGAGCTYARTLQLVPANFAPLSLEQGTDILHKYKEEKSFLLS